jgi:hypothetical protein
MSAGDLPSAGLAARERAVARKWRRFIPDLQTLCDRFLGEAAPKSEPGGMNGACKVMKMRGPVTNGDAGGTK